MLSLRRKFTKSPSMFYAFSIAATWAGAASLLVGIETAQKEGIIPFLLWAAGNTLACVVFGIFAPMIPRLRDIFRSRAMQIVIGLMCPFHVWLSMTGIHTVFSDTPLGGDYGMALAYVIAGLFIGILYWRGLVRNILTDNMSWVLVYALALVLTVAALIHSRGDMTMLTMGTENTAAGLKKCLLLLPGPFIYPYFYTLLDYNDQNEDGTRKINIRRSFTLGGLFFGVYLAFVFLLAWTKFSPALNVAKAFLITLVAMSTLSSFQFSMFTIFGEKPGLVLNILAVATWQKFVHMGVLGIWEMMASIRIFIVAGSIVAALAWHTAGKRKAVAGR